MLFHGGYKPSTLKSNLKMAVTRLAISSNKKSALIKQQIRDIAGMLADSPPREEKARIRAEAIIREDNTIEAYEILSLHCELLCERIHLISHTKQCPPDLLPCVCTLMWASCTVDIPELRTIRTQFRHKYGKEFELRALQNVNGVVNDRVAKKLSVAPPPAREVQLYLEKIAEEQGVEWKPKAAVAEVSSGYSVPTHGGSGLFPSNYNVEEVRESRIDGGRIANDYSEEEEEEYDDDDYNGGGNYVGLSGVGGFGPSAPPLSPMTVNTALLPEAPRNNNFNCHTSAKNGKSWATTNAANTVTTMASTATAAASSSLTPMPCPYVPVLPMPSCSASHLHSLKNDANVEEEGDDSHVNDGRNGYYRGDDDDDEGVGHGNGGSTKAPNMRKGEEEKDDDCLIAEAMRMSKEYEELIAKFEKLNEKKK